MEEMASGGFIILALVIFALFLAVANPTIAGGKQTIKSETHAVKAKTRSWVSRLFYKLIIKSPPEIFYPVGMFGPVIIIFLIVVMASIEKLP